MQQSGGAGFRHRWVAAAAMAGRNPLRPWLWAPFAAFEQVLDVEQARLFLWVPVALGGGIALYFALAQEPGWVTALMPLVIAAVVHGRRLLEPRIPGSEG